MHILVACAVSWKLKVLLLAAFLYSFVFAFFLVLHSDKCLDSKHAGSRFNLALDNYTGSGYAKEVSLTEYRNLFAVPLTPPHHEDGVSEQPRLRSTAIPSDLPTPADREFTERSLFSKVLEIVTQGRDKALSRVFPQARCLSPKAKEQLRGCAQAALAPDFYNLSRLVYQEDGVQCTTLEEMRFTGAEGLPSLWPRTALASFPGSGNTWFRTLLEQTTGIFTGSDDMCDRVLRASGHLGEGITTNDVLAVKTHFRQDKGYERAIVLVRNPFDAILAEYHRSTLWSHVRKLEPAHFEKYTLKWTAGVANLHKGWLEFTKFWLGTNVNVPRIVVSYDNLKVNQTATLVRIMNFLGLNYSRDKLSCVLQMKSAQSFKRPESKGGKYYPYNLRQISHIRRTILAARHLLEHHGIDYNSWLHFSNALLYEKTLTTLQRHKTNNSSGSSTHHIAHKIT